MKFRCMTTVALSVISTIALASLSPKPAHCPSIDALKTQNFHRYQSSSKGWIAYNVNQYGTKERWVFMMGYFNDSNLSYANDYLKKVVGNPSPTPDLDGEGWDCVYSVSGSYLGAIAYTNATSSSYSPTSKVLGKL